MAYSGKCAVCGKDPGPEPWLRCECGGEVELVYDGPPVTATGTSMWRFRSRLPVGAQTAEVTLGEGGTPLIVAERALPGHTVLLKDESRNPTGSMKDRAMSVSFTKAREFGFDRSIIFSTGGAGIAAAAYAARAGVANVVVAPADVGLDRLFLFGLYGSRVVRVAGTVEQVVALVDRASAAVGFYDVSTYRSGNPYQAEAQKTIAFEIAESLGHVPDWMVVPVGGGGTLAGVYEGFAALWRAGLAPTVPRMVGVQNRRFAALRDALDAGDPSEAGIRRVAAAIDSTLPTDTDGLRHAYPPDGPACLEAIVQSGGDVLTVTDANALAWRERLAVTEGIFVEPSAAVALAGIGQLVGQGRIRPQDRVVALLTGAGWRDLPQLVVAAGPPDMLALTADDPKAVDRLGRWSTLG